MLYLITLGLGFLFSVFLTLFWYKFAKQERIKPTSVTHISYDEKYYGKYAHIRAKLDKSFFTNYTKERQLFQDSIIDSYFLNYDENNSHHNYKEKWSIFTCGCFGAGKSHVLNYLDRNHYLDLNEYIMIDPDKLKYTLPEAPYIIKYYPDKVGYALHNESVLLALILQYYALDNNYPIIVDGTLRAIDWHKEHFTELRNKYPSYKLAIIKVDAELDLVKARCKARGLKTGRIIEEKLINDIYLQIPLSFAELQSYVDLTIEITNNSDITIKLGDSPKFSRIENII